MDKELRESDSEGQTAEKGDEESVKWEDEASAEGPSDADRADFHRHQWLHRIKGQTVGGWHRILRSG